MINYSYRNKSEILEMFLCTIVEEKVLLMLNALVVVKFFYILFKLYIFHYAFYFRTKEGFQSYLPAVMHISS